MSGSDDILDNLKTVVKKCIESNDKNNILGVDMHGRAICDILGHIADELFEIHGLLIDEKDERGEKRDRTRYCEIIGDPLDIESDHVDKISKALKHGGVIHSTTPLADGNVLYSICTQRS